MKKRKWVYIQHPTIYEVFCNKCKGKNIAWSEYEHRIWCYDCRKDVVGTGGIFDGPIPIKICEMVGISFWRRYLKSDKIMKPVMSKHFLVYRMCSQKELKLLR